MSDSSDVSLIPSDDEDFELWLNKKKAPKKGKAKAAVKAAEPKKVEPKKKEKAVAKPKKGKAKKGKTVATATAKPKKVKPKKVKQPTPPPISHIIAPIEDTEKTIEMRDPNSETLSSGSSATSSATSGDSSTPSISEIMRNFEDSSEESSEESPSKEFVLNNNTVYEAMRLHYDPNNKYPNKPIKYLIKQYEATIQGLDNIVDEYFINVDQQHLLKKLNKAYEERNLAMIIELFSNSVFNVENLVKILDLENEYSSKEILLKSIDTFGFTKDVKENLTEFIKKIKSDVSHKIDKYRELRTQFIDAEDRTVRKALFEKMNGIVQECGYREIQFPDEYEWINKLPSIISGEKGDKKKKITKVTIDTIRNGKLTAEQIIRLRTFIETSINAYNNNIADPEDYEWIRLLIAASQKGNIDKQTKLPLEMYEVDKNITNNALKIKTNIDKRLRDVYVQLRTDIDFASFSDKQIKKYHDLKTKHKNMSEEKLRELAKKKE